MALKAAPGDPRVRSEQLVLPLLVGAYGYPIQASLVLLLSRGRSVDYELIH